MKCRARRLFLASARLRPIPASDPLAVDLGPQLRLGPPAPGGRPEGLESPLWEEAAALARRVGQEPIFQDFALRHAPEGSLRASTLADLKTQSKFHAFRWAEIRDSVSTLLEAASRSGVRPVLLKGIACAGECYEPAHLRPMRDVDVLVEARSLDAFRQAAEQSGFLGEKGSTERYAGHHHLPPLFHAATEICLEIHHHIMRLPSGFEGFPEIGAFFEDLEDSKVFPGRAFTLSPAMQVLTTCIHITHGDWIGRRVQNLFDLVRLVDFHQDRLDWERLIAHARSPDVARSLAVPFLYLEREGLPTAPPGVLAELRSRSKLRWWDLAILSILTDRYRVGSPPPWRWISGRLSTLLWRQALRRESTPRRALAFVREALSGRARTG